uniref:Uncharacterized protein n=1 Tax=Alexandrium catenella TaxID=2925 RepID=A0A7S1RHA4_ALECA
MGVFADGQAGLPRLLQAVLWRTLATVPQFSVCVANGSIMGEGLGFLACCDYAVAVAGSFLSPADIHYGLVPAVLAPYILNKMGTGATKRLFCTCENISAERAVADGLVDDVAPSLEAAHGLVRGLCERLTGCGPRSVDAAKELVAGVSGQQITEPLMFYTCAFAQRALASEEAQQAVRAAGGSKPWEGKAIQPLH